MSGGRRGGRLRLLLDLALEEAAALCLVHDFDVVVDGHVGAVGRMAVVLGPTAFRKETQAGFKFHDMTGKLCQTPIKLLGT